MINNLLLVANTAAQTTEQGGGGGWILYIGYFIFFGLLLFFLFIRPQNKEKKKISAMLSSMEVGDIVLTTSGFYGVLIDISDEDVIVEFGNNKNCRIPMKKTAIAEIEKAEQEHL